MATAYVGFHKGLFVELLRMAGLVSATALACNFYGRLSEALKPWWAVNPAAREFLCFLVLLAAGLFIFLRLVVKIVLQFVKCEQLHWTVQGLGIAVGGLRGWWWSGMLLMLLAATGVPYLDHSIRERSRLAPIVLRTAGDAFVKAADAYPGSRQRISLLPHWPSAKAGAAK